MRMRFEDFVELHHRNQAVAPTRIVRRTGQGHYEMIMQGSVYSRASDKQYVLDNVRDRATHVELPEQHELLKLLFPDVAGLVVRSDINLPPDEFFLMQDIYQLPDTGDWNVGQAVAAEDLEEPPPVSHHMCAALHEGTLITNHLINALRRRVSYLREGDRFVRSRDRQFLVRPRTQKVLVVVDKAETRDTLRQVATPTAHYTLDHYVLEEEGINLKRLDRGDIEHIGLIRHLKARHQRPDVILFEPHREAQRKNTATTIMQQNARIDAKFRFKGIKCGQIDIGLSAEGLHEAIMGFFNENVDEARTDDGASGESGRQPSGVRARLVEYDIRQLVRWHHAFARDADRNEEAIRAGLTEQMRKASQVVLQIIEQKLLRSVHDEDALAAMSAEEKRAAIADYVTDYHQRVAHLRQSLFYETVLRETLDLARAAYDRKFGEAAAPRFADAERVAAKEALGTLRDTYADEAGEGIGDQELVGLYQRDFTKLLQARVVARIGEDLGLL